MRTVIAVVAMASLCSGCMSTGGLVIGPCSYGTSKMNEPDVIKRASLQVKAPPQVFRGIQAGMRDGEFAVGMGVDVLALKEAIQSEQLTGGEAVLQAAGVIADSALYGFAAKKTGLLDYVREGFGTKTSKGEGSLQVTGDGNTVIYSTGEVRLDQSNNSGN